MLGQKREFVTTNHLKDWVSRLNHISNDYVATEWEAILLRAFARFGNVQHEPPLGPRPIDMVFESLDGNLKFAADITAISDEPLHEKNPIDRLQAELRRRITNAKINTGRLPADPIDGVLPWHYTGNYNHPTKKAVDTLKPIIEAFTKAGDVVLDPFSGSGSSLVAAALLRRQYIGIELEQRYCDHARRRWAGATRYLAIPRREPQREQRRSGAGLVDSGPNSLRKGPA